MSLKQLMTEIIGRPVLYHFTSPNSFAKIVPSDSLSTKQSKLNAISLTRNHALIIRFKSPLRMCIRFTLDWNRLKDFHKISPFLDGHQGFETQPRDITKWDTNSRKRFNTNRKMYDEEMEEQVKKDITDLHKFIVQIDVSKFVLKVAFFKENDQYIDNYIQENILNVVKADPIYKNIPLNIVDKWESVKL